MLRKITRLLPLLALSLTIGLSSCVKEKDITETETELEKPKPGEIIMLRGTVRDTSEQGIAEASLRIQLDGFEKDFTTDNTGYFEVEVPFLEEEAVVVAAKTAYVRSIQRYLLDSYEVEKDIYLIDDEAVEVTDLTVDYNNLFRITGCLLDQFDIPLSEIFLRGESETINEEEVKYSAKSNQEGCFEFLVERDVFAWHFLLASSFDSPCLDFITEFRVAPEMSLDDGLFDWGSVRFPISRQKEISPNIALDPCYEGEYVNHVYRPGGGNIRQELLPPSSSIIFCDTSINEAWIYNGVLSPGEQAFDGSFVRFSEFNEQRNYSLCLPAEKFVEIRFESETLLFLEPTYNSSERTIQVSDDSGTIEFQLQGNFSSTTTRTDEEGNRISASADFSRIGKLNKTGPDNSPIFELDPSSPRFANRIDGRFTQGVLTAIIRWNDGRTETVTIRYSV